MGSRSSKHGSVSAVEPLSNETITELCNDTGFSPNELLTWHSNFYKDCPDGKLTLKQFEQEYSKIMGKPTQKTADYIRHMFNVYDHDKNQFIDFKEFVMALSAASVVNRLRLVETLFHVFDLDNDGKITKEEISKMLHTLVDVTDSNDKRHRHHRSNDHQRNKLVDLQKRIDDAFNELNANDDDHITKDEFIEWYMKSGLIAEGPDTVKVHDPSHIQQIGKKSRKLIRQATSAKPNHEHDEHRHQRGPVLVRHISRMTEKKPISSKYDDDDDVDNEDNNHQQATTVSSLYNNNHLHDNDMDDEPSLTRPTVRFTKSSEDTDSHYSKDNERWQHLFNSVLGQIRAQRHTEQQINNNHQQQPTPQQQSLNKANFSSWKREGAEKLTVEYIKQRSTTEQNHLTSSNRYEPLSSFPSTGISDETTPPSPDVITVRF